MDSTHRRAPATNPPATGTSDDWVTVVDDDTVYPAEPVWVDHVLCDYPITGYHARGCGWTGGAR